MNVSVAREIAFDAYVQVMENRKRPELILEEVYGNGGKAIKRVDRNLVKEILYGGLRWHSKIYWILQNTSKRDLNTTSPEVRAALVLGTYQIFYMDRIPDRAAVNESVEYIRKKGQASACPFVNGILRQISRRAAYFPKPDKVTLPAEYLSLQFAHPKWIVDRWLKNFKFERMEEMLAANNQVPPCSIRVNTLKVPLDEVHKFQQELLRSERTHSDRRPLRCTLRLKESPRKEPDSLFGQGYFTIQDEASQLIGYLASPQEGQTIVDTCCGPGGKLSHLYELGNGKLRLIGIEKDTLQLERAQQCLTRLGHEKVELCHEDFLAWKTRKKIDKILLDSPCSGLGVLRRHPEGKWQKSEDIVSKMVECQKEFLEKAIAVIRSGGEIIYSVCSFELEETREHLVWLKKKYGDKIEVVSPVFRLPDYYKRYVTRENILLIYSGNKDALDGFGAFIIKVHK